MNLWRAWAPARVRRKLKPAIRQCHSFEADVAKNRELLKPIESRIFRNTLKNDKSLRNAIEKDKARAQEYKDAIAAGEKRIAELKAKLTKEQKAIGDNSKQP